LPIGLRVICCAQTKLNASQLEQLTPKSTCKDSVSIRVNRLRKTVEFVNIGEKAMSHRRSCKRMHETNKVCILGK
jgi:hypothetical protein